LARSVLIDGRYRSAVTLPGYRCGMRPANAGKTYPFEVYSREQINRLLAAYGRGYAGARDRAAVVVMWRCGLRVAEMTALMPRELDLDAGTVTVMHGKGDRRRVVGIDPQAAAVVDGWLRKRARLGLGARHPVFCVISRPSVGKRWYTSCVRESVKDAGTRAGLTAEGVRVHPHGLRHTYASELAREGVPLPMIQALLGHKSLATTARYVHQLAPWEAIEIAQRRRWDQELTHRQRSLLEQLGPLLEELRPLILNGQLDVGSGIRLAA